MTHRSVVIEADGGSRGNPGPAGFGALVRDADTGQVIAMAARSIGRATNNVAEYSGLIAGLELYLEHTPGAQLEVRMDSKLVIEQMAGRWRVRNQDMRPLAMRAQQLAPSATAWTWVPRESNTDADRLANLAMDAAARGEIYDVQGESGSGQALADQPDLTTAGRASADPTPEALEPAEDVAAPTPDSVAEAESPRSGARPSILGWSGLEGEETTLIFLRHGETKHTAARRFSGPGGDDPGLDETGWAQVRRAADALAADGGVDAIVSSPLRRARETASVVAESVHGDVVIEEGFREAAFGAWDGLTLHEVQQRWPDELDAWLRSFAHAPPGGESIEAVRARVEEALGRILTAYAGQTVLVVSHVNPIKLSVRYCLEAPMAVTNKMLLAPASLTTMTFYASGASALRQFSAIP